MLQRPLSSVDKLQKSTKQCSSCSHERQQSSQCRTTTLTTPLADTYSTRRRYLFCFIILNVSMMAYLIHQFQATWRLVTLSCCFSRYKFTLLSYLLVKILQTSIICDTSVFKNWQFIVSRHSLISITIGKYNDLPQPSTVCRRWVTWPVFHDNDSSCWNRSLSLILRPVTDESL